MTKSVVGPGGLVGDVCFTRKTFKRLLMFGKINFNGL